MLPKNTWVSSVEPSQHDDATCYVTFDGHMGGDMRTYVARTTDLGATWTMLPVTDVKGYAHIIRQDPVQSKILYLGTEFGLWISLDNSTTWISFRNNLPMVAVRDIAFQQRDHALAIATHGRGIYVIDELDVLRAIDPAAIRDEITVLPTVPAVRTQGGGAGRWFAGDADYVGESRSESARVWYVLKDRHVRGQFTITIKDSSGNVIRTTPGSSRKGLNSVELAMRRPAPLTASSEVGGAFGSLIGPLLAEGAYSVELNKAGTIATTSIRVVTDTIYGHSDADREAQQQLVAQLYTLNEELAITVAQIQSGRDELLRRLTDSTLTDQVAKAKIKDGFDSLDALNKELVNTKIGAVTGEEQLRERLSSLFGEVNGFLGRPTASQRSLATLLGARVASATEKAQKLLSPWGLESRRAVEERLRKSRGRK